MGKQYRVGSPIRAMTKNIEDLASALKTYNDQVSGLTGDARTSKISDLFGDEETYQRMQNMQEQVEGFTDELTKDSLGEGGMSLKNIFEADKSGIASLAAMKNIISEAAGSAREMQKSLASITSGSKGANTFDKVIQNFTRLASAEFDVSQATRAMATMSDETKNYYIANEKDIVRRTREAYRIEAAKGLSASDTSIRSSIVTGNGFIKQALDKQGRDGESIDQIAKLAIATGVKRTSKNNYRMGMIVNNGSHPEGPKTSYDVLPSDDYRDLVIGHGYGRKNASSQDMISEGKITLPNLDKSYSDFYKHLRAKADEGNSLAQAVALRTGLLEFTVDKSTGKRVGTWTPEAAVLKAQLQAVKGLTAQEYDSAEMSWGMWEKQPGDTKRIAKTLTHQGKAVGNALAIMEGDKTGEQGDVAYLQQLDLEQRRARTGESMYGQYVHTGQRNNRDVDYTITPNISRYESIQVPILTPSEDGKSLLARQADGTLGPSIDYSYRKKGVEESDSDPFMMQQRTPIIERIRAVSEKWKKDGRNLDMLFDFTNRGYGAGETIERTYDEKGNATGSSRERIKPKTPPVTWVDISDIYDKDGNVDPEKKKHMEGIASGYYRPEIGGTRYVAVTGNYINGKVMAIPEAYADEIDREDYLAGRHSMIYGFGNEVKRDKNGRVMYDEYHRPILYGKKGRASNEEYGKFYDRIGKVNSNGISIDEQGFSEVDPRVALVNLSAYYDADTTRFGGTKTVTPVNQRFDGGGYMSAKTYGTGQWQVRMGPAKMSTTSLNILDFLRDAGFQDNDGNIYLANSTATHEDVERYYELTKARGASHPITKGEVAELEKLKKEKFLLMNPNNQEYYNMLLDSSTTLKNLTEYETSSLDLYRRGYRYYQDKSHRAPAGMPVKSDAEIEAAIKQARDEGRVFTQDGQEFIRQNAEERLFQFMHDSGGHIYTMKKDADEAKDKDWFNPAAISATEYLGELYKKSRTNLAKRRAELETPEGVIKYIVNNNPLFKDRFDSQGRSYLVSEEIEKEKEAMLNDLTEQAVKGQLFLPGQKHDTSIAPDPGSTFAAALEAQTNEQMASNSRTGLILNETPGKRGHNLIALSMQLKKKQDSVYGMRSPYAHGSSNIFNFIDNAKAQAYVSRYGLPSDAAIMSIQTAFEQNDADFDFDSISLLSGLDDGLMQKESAHQDLVRKKAEEIKKRIQMQTDTQGKEPLPEGYSFIDQYIRRQEANKGMGLAYMLGHAREVNPYLSEDETAYIEALANIQYSQYVDNVKHNTFLSEIEDAEWKTSTHGKVSDRGIKNLSEAYEEFDNNGSTEKLKNFDLLSYATPMVFSNNSMEYMRQVQEAIAADPNYENKFAAKIDTYLHAFTEGKTAEETAVYNWLGDIWKTQFGSANPVVSREQLAQGEGILEELDTSIDVAKGSQNEARVKTLSDLRRKLSTRITDMKRFGLTEEALSDESVRENGMFYKARGINLGEIQRNFISARKATPFEQAYQQAAQEKRDADRATIAQLASMNAQPDATIANNERTILDRITAMKEFGSASVTASFPFVEKDYTHDVASTGLYRHNYDTGETVLMPGTDGTEISVDFGGSGYTKYRKQAIIRDITGQSDTDAKTHVGSIGHNFISQMLENAIATGGFTPTSASDMEDAIKTYLLTPNPDNILTKAGLSVATNPNGGFVLSKMDANDTRYTPQDLAAAQERLNDIAGLTTNVQGQKVPSIFQRLIDTFGNDLFKDSSIFELEGSFFDKDGKKMVLPANIANEHGIYYNDPDSQFTRIGVDGNQTKGKGFYFTPDMIRKRKKEDGSFVYDIFDWKSSAHGLEAGTVQADAYKYMLEQIAVEAHKKINQGKTGYEPFKELISDYNEETGTYTSHVGDLYLYDMFGGTFRKTTPTKESSKSAMDIVHEGQKNHSRIADVGAAKNTYIGREADLGEWVGLEVRAELDKNKRAETNKGNYNVDESDQDHGGEATSIPPDVKVNNGRSNGGGGSGGGYRRNGGTSDNLVDQLYLLDKKKKLDEASEEAFSLYKKNKYNTIENAHSLDIFGGSEFQNAIDKLNEAMGGNLEARYEQYMNHTLSKSDLEQQEIEAFALIRDLREEEANSAAVDASKIVDDSNFSLYGAKKFGSFETYEKTLKKISSISNRNNAILSKENEYVQNGDFLTNLTDYQEYNKETNSALTDDQGHIIYRNGYTEEEAKDLVARAQRAKARYESTNEKIRQARDMAYTQMYLGAQNEVTASGINLEKDLVGVTNAHDNGLAYLGQQRQSRITQMATLEGNKDEIAKLAEVTADDGSRKQLSEVWNKLNTQQGVLKLFNAAESKMAPGAANEFDLSTATGRAAYQQKALSRASDMSIKEWQSAHAEATRMRNANAKTKDGEKMPYTEEQIAKAEMREINARQVMETIDKYEKDSVYSGKIAQIQDTQSALGIYGIKEGALDRRATIAKLEQDAANASERAKSQTEISKKADERETTALDAAMANEDKIAKLKEAESTQRQEQKNLRDEYMEETKWKTRPLMGADYTQHDVQYNFLDEKRKKIAKDLDIFSRGSEIRAKENEISELEEQKKAINDELSGGGLTARERKSLKTRRSIIQKQIDEKNGALLPIKRGYERDKKIYDEADAEAEAERRRIEDSTEGVRPVADAPIKKIPSTEPGASEEDGTLVGPHQLKLMEITDAAAAKSIEIRHTVETREKAQDEQKELNDEHTEAKKAAIEAKRQKEEAENNEAKRKAALERYKAYDEGLTNIENSSKEMDAEIAANRANGKYTRTVGYDFMSRAYNGLITRREEVDRLRASKNASDKSILDLTAERDILKDEPWSKEREKKVASLNKQIEFKQKESKGYEKQIERKSSFGGTMSAMFAEPLGNAISGGVSKLMSSALNEAKQFIMQYQQQMRQIQAITMKSDSQMSAVGSSSVKQAVKLGTSVSDVLSVKSALYRQGMSDSEVEAGTEDVIKFSKVSGSDISSSIKGLTTAVKSGLVDSLEEAMDAMTALGDAAATTAAEISAAMQKCAASATTANVSYSELTAMLTIVEEKTQLSGTQVGTAFNTLFTRMRSITNENFVTDEGGKTTSINDVEESLKFAGINMRTDEGELKSTYDILLDLSKVWERLSDLQKSNIATSMAGTRQSNMFYSLMEGMSDDGGETLQKYLDLASNSEGITDEKYATIINTTSAAIESLTSAFDGFFTSLSENTIVANVIKGIAEGFQSFNEISNSTVKAITTIIVAIMALTAALAAYKIVASFSKAGGVGTIAGVAAAAIAAGSIVALGSGLANGITALEKKNTTNAEKTATTGTITGNDVKNAGERIDDVEDAYDTLKEIKKKYGNDFGKITSFSDLGEDANKAADAVNLINTEMEKFGATANTAANACDQISNAMGNMETYKNNFKAEQYQDMIDSATEYVKTIGADYEDYYKDYEQTNGFSEITDAFVAVYDPGDDKDNLLSILYEYNDAFKYIKQKNVYDENGKVDLNDNDAIANIAAGIADSNIWDNEDAAKSNASSMNGVLRGFFGTADEMKNLMIRSGLISADEWDIFSTQNASNLQDAVLIKIMNAANSNDDSRKTAASEIVTDMTKYLLTKNGGYFFGQNNNNQSYSLDAFRSYAEDTLFAEGSPLYEMSEYMFGSGSYEDTMNSIINSMVANGVDFSNATAVQEALQRQVSEYFTKDASYARRMIKSDDQYTYKNGSFKFDSTDKAGIETEFEDEVYYEYMNSLEEEKANLENKQFIDGYLNPEEKARLTTLTNYFSLEDKVRRGEASNAEEASYIASRNMFKRRAFQNFDFSDANNIDENGNQYWTLVTNGDGSLGIEFVDADAYNAWRAQTEYNDGSGLVNKSMKELAQGVYSSVSHESKGYSDEYSALLYAANQSTDVDDFNETVGNLFSNGSALLTSDTTLAEMMVNRDKYSYDDIVNYLYNKAMSKTRAEQFSNIQSTGYSAWNSNRIANTTDYDNLSEADIATITSELGIQRTQFDANKSYYMDRYKTNIANTNIDTFKDTVYNDMLTSGFGRFIYETDDSNELVLNEDGTYKSKRMIPYQNFDAAWNAYTATLTKEAAAEETAKLDAIKANGGVLNYDSTTGQFYVTYDDGTTKGYSVTNPLKKYGLYKTTSELSKTASDIYNKYTNVDQMTVDGNEDELALIQENFPELYEWLNMSGDQQASAHGQAIKKQIEVQFAVQGISDLEEAGEVVAGITEDLTTIATSDALTALGKINEVKSTQESYVTAQRTADKIKNGQSITESELNAAQTIYGEQNIKDLINGNITDEEFDIRTAGANATMQETMKATYAGLFANAYVNSGGNSADVKDITFDQINDMLIPGNSGYTYAIKALEYMNNMGYGIDENGNVTLNDKNVSLNDMTYSEYLAAASGYNNITSPDTKQYYGSIMSMLSGTGTLGENIEAARQAAVASGNTGFINMLDSVVASSDYTNLTTDEERADYWKNYAFGLYGITPDYSGDVDYDKATSIFNDLLSGNRTSYDDLAKSQTDEDKALLQALSGNSYVARLLAGEKLTEKEATMARTSMAAIELQAKETAGEIAEGSTSAYQNVRKSKADAISTVSGWSSSLQSYDDAITSFNRLGTVDQRSTDWEAVQNYLGLTDNEIDQYKNGTKDISELSDKIKDTGGDVIRNVKGVLEGLYTEFDVNNLSDLKARAASSGDEIALAFVEALENIIETYGVSLTNEDVEGSANKTGSAAAYAGSEGALESEAIAKKNAEIYDIYTTSKDAAEWKRRMDEGKYSEEDMTAFYNAYGDESKVYTERIKEGLKGPGLAKTTNEMGINTLIPVKNVGEYIGQNPDAEIVAGGTYDEFGQDQSQFRTLGTYGGMYKDNSFVNGMDALKEGAPELYEQLMGGTATAETISGLESFAADNPYFAEALTQLQSYEDWITNTQNITEGLDAQGEAAKKCSAIINSTIIKSTQKMGKYSDEAADAVLNLAKGGEDALDTMEEYGDMYEEAAEKIEAYNKYKNGDKSAANTILGKNWSTSWIEDSSDYVDELVEAEMKQQLENMVVGMSALSAVVNPNIEVQPTFDYEAKTAGIELKDLTDEEVEKYRNYFTVLQELLNGMGIKIELDESGDANSKTLSIIASLLNSPGSSSKSGGGGSGKSKSQKLLDKLKNEATVWEHKIKMAQNAQAYYQETGELKSYGNAIQEEIDITKDYISVLEQNNESILAQMKKVKQGSDDWISLRDAYMENEEKISDYTTAIEKNTTALKENDNEINKTVSDVQDTLSSAFSEAEKKEEDMLSGSVSMQQTILQAIQQRYSDEWELISEDIEKKKEALEEEKNLISERLQKRKDAADEEKKYEELAEYQKQYALISMDSTRTKDAKELEEKIKELEEELYWDLAEDEVEAQQDAIDEEIESYDQYTEDKQEDLDAFLEDANNFTAEISELMKLSQEELFSWLSQNVEEYVLGFEDYQKQLMNSWEDTWNQMYGITETYWEEIALIMTSEEKFLEYMKTTDEYINATDETKAQKIYEWQTLWETMVDANAEGEEYSHDVEIEDVSISVKKNAKGGLVDYTGLTWVDGTFSDPEAFLSADDTRLIRSMLDAANSTGFIPYASMIDTSEMTGCSVTVGDVNVTLNEAEINTDEDYAIVAQRVGEAFVKELSKNGLNMGQYNF